MNTSGSVGSIVFPVHRKASARDGDWLVGRRAPALFAAASTWPPRLPGSASTPTADTV